MEVKFFENTFRNLILLEGEFGLEETFYQRGNFKCSIVVIRIEYFT